MASTLHTALLVNPKAGAGRAKQAVSQVLKRLLSHNLEPTILEATSSQEALASIRVAVESGTDRLIVIGGDGILHIAAQALAGTPCILGVIAAGTGNDFGRAMGLTKGSLEDRVDRTLEKPTPIDLIKVGNQFALTSVISGFPSQVNDRAERMRFPTGPSRYTCAALLELPKMQTIETRIAMDSVDYEILSTMIVVANTRFFGGGMDICPNADPTDGQIDVCTVGDVGRLDLLRSLHRVRNGKHLEHPEVTIRKTKEVVIKGKMTFRADGESLDLSDAESQISICVAPQKILLAGSPY